jgi:hypothetical protein
MSIRKGVVIDFTDAPISVHVLFNNQTMEGVDIEDIVGVFREEDNTIILTKSNGAKVIINKDKYYLITLGDK